MKKRWLAAVLCLCLAAGLLPSTVLAAEVTVTPTDISADTVYNYDGYGSLVKRNPRQAALIDRNGSFKFQYRNSENPMANYGLWKFENGSMVNVAAGSADADAAYPRFWYSAADDIVSFTTGLTWNFTNFAHVSPAEYYHLDGSTAFSLGENYLGGPMRSGYARVMEQYDKLSTAKQARIIDKNGSVVCDLPEQFQWTGQEGGYASTKLTDCGENLLAFIEYVPDESGIIYYDYPNRVGFMDPHGNVVQDLGKRYLEVGAVYGGIASVVDQNYNVGFIDKTGKEIIPCQYQWCNYNGGLIGAQKNGKWGFIDNTGKEVIPFEYDSAFAGTEDLLSVAKNGKYGLIDKSNQVIVPLEYDDITEYIDGVAYAIKDGRISIITKGTAPATPEPETPAPAPAPTPEPAPAPAPAVSFTDVGPGDWHAAAINYVVSRSLMDGTGSGMFSPRAAATRGTVVTALERLNGVNVGDGADPNGAVSREQLVSMLFRSANSPAVSGSLSGFPDASAVSGQAADAMVWAVSNGLVQGDGSGALNPGGSATRAQAATVLMRFCEKFGK